MRSPARCASEDWAFAFACSIWRRICPHRSSSQLTLPLASTLFPVAADEPELAASPPTLPPERAADTPAVTTGNRPARCDSTVASATRYAASADAIDWLACKDCSTRLLSLSSPYMR